MCIHTSTIADRKGLSLAWLAHLFVVGLASLTIADTRLVPEEFPTIQAAIDASVNDDVISIADGTWTGDGNRDIDFGGRAITVMGRNGAEMCTIDIQGSALEPHRAFHFHSGETEHSVVEGLTIQNGYMMGRAGAVLCEAGSSPVFIQCHFRLNKVDGTTDRQGGGAVFCYESDSSFVECRFTENHISAKGFQVGGGAVYTDRSNTTFIGCEFVMNSADGGLLPHGGGAVVLGANGSALLDGCTFTANRSSQVGGAVIIGWPISTVFRDCTFTQNSAAADGGAIFTGNGLATQTLINSRITGNVVGEEGGGIMMGFDQELVVINSTIADNQGGTGGGVYLFPGASATIANSILGNNAPNEVFTSDPELVTVHYSNIEGGWEGPGNIDEDPMFVDPGNGDFRLTAGSPCIDAGDTGVVSEDTDLDGSPRRVDDLGSPDMGEGGSPMVDMGAYEFQDHSPGLRLRLRSSCPDSGPTRFGLANATPSRPTALLFARTSGSFVIPNQYPCAGTQLGLGAQELQIAWQGNAGADGSKVINTNAPAMACGGYLQVLDVATCGTSNVVRIE